MGGRVDKRSLVGASTPSNHTVGQGTMQGYIVRLLRGTHNVAFVFIHPDFGGHRQRLA